MSAPAAISLAARRPIAPHPLAAVPAVNHHHHKGTTIMEAIFAAALCIGTAIGGGELASRRT